MGGSLWRKLGMPGMRRLRKPKDKHIHIRASEEKRERWAAAVAESGLTWSEWIRQALDRAAKRAAKR